MTLPVHLVTRHPDVPEWLERQGIHADSVIPHLDVQQISPGDTYIGSLPVHLACEICMRGARYLHIRIDRPFELRGVELRLDAMNHLGAALEGYHVSRLTPSSSSVADRDP